ncbi:MAG TPA: putative manganese-dependent inorganic diphosphatase [Ardenticatenaceae bacterium]|nr:putative manganese-dependent inorganic diphosphatase [Ardenticatenaceae bacterium]
MEPVYVFGHKNPDTDSICSAIAYAYLKNTQSAGNIPARLGELNRETQFVLGSFDVPTPVFLPHVHIRVQDVMTRKVISAPVQATVYDVGDLLRDHQIHAIPIVDGAGRPQGVVTERGLARSYLKELEVQSLRDAPAELGKIAATLDGRLVVGSPTTQVQGNAVIGAMSPEAMVHFIAPDDLVLVGDRENAQEAALSCGISCLVVTGDFEPSPRIQNLARARGSAILVTPYDTFAAARLINLSVPAVRLLEPDILTASPETLVTEITPDLLESDAGIMLVTDDDERLVGVVTKRDVLARRRRRVILVDHSERGQSADGIERAEIVEIIDHHRLGGLETSGPILAVIVPVGCTATLVLRRYRELGVEPPREMAGLMVASILSDTVLLKSPTTTPEDVAAVEALGKLMREDALAFGTRMYNAKFDIAHLSPDQFVANDLKVFVFGSAAVGIGQIEVGDAALVLRRKADLVEAMERHRRQHALDLLLLMVTDIVRGGTELLAVGQTRVVERAFGTALQDHSLYLPGVLSRKKQVVPPISSAF